MNQIFNGKVKYSTEKLKSEYTGDNFWLVNEEGSFFKIQLLNIFKNNQIVAWTCPTVKGYGRWPLSNAF